MRGESKKPKLSNADAKADPCGAKRDAPVIVYSAAAFDSDHQAARAGTCARVTKAGTGEPAEAVCRALEHVQRRAVCGRVDLLGETIRIKSSEAREALHFIPGLA